MGGEGAIHEFPRGSDHFFVEATRRVAPAGRLRVNIQLEFIGFPIIYDLFPEGPHPYSLAGTRLGQLVEGLAAHEDPRIRESLLDPGTGSLDPTIQIMINHKLVPKTKIQEKEFAEGDHVIFLKLLAGG